MNKKIIGLLIFLLLIMSSPSWAAKIYSATSLTGGGVGALDAISGASLSNGDKAMVIGTGQVYWYTLNATSGASESSPNIIAPDTGGGAKRWLLVQTDPKIDAVTQYGSGTSYTGATVLAAFVAQGTSFTGTVVMRPGNYVLSENLDLSAYTIATLEMMPGAYFSGNFTIKLPGGFDADPSQQCFSGTGTVSGLYYKTPEMFGARDDSGTTDCTAAFTSALAGGGVIEVMAPKGGYYKITTAITASVDGTKIISKAKAEIRQATANTGGLAITTSNVEVRGIKLQGPQCTTYKVDEKAIFFHGTDGVTIAPTYISKIKIIDCIITNWGAWGILGRYAQDFEIANNYIEDITYVGISVQSCKRYRIHHNHIQDIPGDEPTLGNYNAYGIGGGSFLQDAGNTTTTDPPSEDGLIDSNYIYNIPTWECLDTHGGLRINFIGNICVDVAEGVMIGSTAYVTAGANIAKYCSAVGNIFIRGSATRDYYGATISGGSGYPTEHCKIADNTMTGFGLAGVRLVYDNHSIVSGNNIYSSGYASGGAGIFMSGSNHDFIINGNNIDTLVAGAEAGIHFDSATSVSGIVSNNIIDATNADYAIDTDSAGTFHDITFINNKMSGFAVSAQQTQANSNWDRIVDNADASTSGTGEDTLESLTLYRYQYVAGKGLRIRAAGTKTGSNGNKTLKFYLGTATYTFNAAANDTNDWRLEAEIWFTAAATQRITWVGYNGITLLQGYEAASEDNDAAAVTFKITGECANASDTITKTIFIAERLEGSI